MTKHSDLTGADIHEPKGIGSASAGQVYVANGGGSGAWSQLTPSFLNFSASNVSYYTNAVPFPISSSQAVVGSDLTASGTKVTAGRAGTILVFYSVVTSNNASVSLRKNGTTLVSFGAGGDTPDGALAVAVQTGDYLDFTAGNTFNISQLRATFLFI